jgi:hypothetical protein
MKVGPELVEPIPLWLERAFRHDDTKLTRWSTLNLRKQLSVEAQLDERCAARLLRELGLDGFIEPLAEAALALGSKEHICPAGPGSNLEASLNDRVCAATHGLHGCSEWILAVLFDLDDALPAPCEVLHV